MYCACSGEDCLGIATCTHGDRLASFLSISLDWTRSNRSHYTYSNICEYLTHVHCRHTSLPSPFIHAFLPLFIPTPHPFFYILPPSLPPSLPAFLSLSLPLSLLIPPPTPLLWQEPGSVTSVQALCNRNV